jgi:tetratricopeptide (TPR) repeat protein
MTMQESSQDSWGGPARRQLHDKAYFLDLLGDSHNGLGRHETAIEAYRQAAEGFRAQGAQCSYALCLFKVADSYLSLGEPWHALGYLEACLPLLQELGLTRHEARARQQLAHCRAELVGARLLALGEGRAEPAGISTAAHPAPGPRTPGPGTRRRAPGQPKHCRRIHATRVDSCYARDRRTAALAEP